MKTKNMKCVKCITEKDQRVQRKGSLKERWKSYSDKL